MGCNMGDSIRAGHIESYESILDRVDFSDAKSYELSYHDISGIYEGISSKMSSIGFTEKAALLVHNSDEREGTIRLIFKRKQEYDYIHPDVYVARAGALIQNMLVLHYGDIRYINFLKTRIRCNIGNLSRGYLKPYYSGYCIQDIRCRFYDDPSEIEEFLNRNIGIVSSQLETLIFDRIHLNCTYNLMPSDVNLMIGLADRDAFKDLVSRYTEWYQGDKVLIQEQDIRASIHLMLKDKMYPKDDIKIRIAQYRDKWLIGFSAPIGVSPYLVLKTLYPKIKLNEIYHHCQFVITGVYRPLSRVRGLDVTSDSLYQCSCHKDLVYDMIQQRVSRTCLDCTMCSLMGAYSKL